MTDGAKLLPRRRELGGELRPRLADPAELRGVTARSAPAADQRVRFDLAVFSQLQLELLPPDYYFG